MGLHAHILDIAGTDTFQENGTDDRAKNEREDSPLLHIAKQSNTITVKPKGIPNQIVIEFDKDSIYRMRFIEKSCRIEI